MKIGTSVTARAMLERDAGQAGVSPHSLKLEASMGRTLPMALLLSTRGRPSAGSKDGGAFGEEKVLFPFSACFGAVAVKRTERKLNWEGGVGRRRSREIGRAGHGEGRITMQEAGLHSQADSRAAWGSGDAHVQSTATC